MHRVRSSLLALVLSALLAASAVAPGHAADPATVRLAVPKGTAYGSVLNTLDETVGAQVTVDVARLDRGVLRAGPVRGTRRTMDFPAFSPSSAEPRAVVRITPRSTSNDVLAPRWHDFEFGAEFRKDSTSSGTSVDNGDNLIQRDLWSDPAQFKVDIDDGRPACRIKGSAGSVSVRASVSVQSSLWYQVRCARTGNTVRLTVTEHRTDGTTRTWRYQRSGSLGRLVWPKTKTPLSVGGKLAASGAVIRSATDQFNGLVRNPLLIIRG